MSKSIAELVAKMQAMFENNDGTLSGGFTSLVNGNVRDNVFDSNERCAEKTINIACVNTFCGGSMNFGHCLNEKFCKFSRDIQPTGDGGDWGCGDPRTVSPSGNVNNVNSNNSKI